MRTERGSELPTYVAKWTREEIEELLIVCARSALNKERNTSALEWTPAGKPVSDGYGGYKLILVGTKIDAKSK